MNHTFKLSRSFDTTVTPTSRVQAIAAAFGIGLDEGVKVELYRDLPVTIGPGRIVYITGDSGAGKSTMLADIRANVRATAGYKDIGDGVYAAGDEGWDTPVIDQVGTGIQDACDLLNQVGISEAFVYLRTPKQLSDGQRYRFMLAKAIDKARSMTAANQQPVIIVDEFLAVLDREVARNVAYQVRRAASKNRLCFVVATTHQDIRADLQPNLTITLRLNLPPEMTSRPLAGT